jgi:hypothetical protein
MRKAIFLILATLMTVLKATLITSPVKLEVAQKFFREGFNFPWMALYLYMMGLCSIVLLDILLAGIVAGIVICIIILILWLKRRKCVNNKNASASPPSSDSTDASTQENKPKVCRSRCWCCLNCLDCQQRRPPGFEPFPKKQKRKYFITQSERKRRSQRMKKRWAKDREGMLKKIREGIWRWLLDMEPCGCWCCKICSRCQAEEKHKQTKAKPQEKDKKAQEKTKNNKKQSPRGQIKSLGKRTRPSKRQIKSETKSSKASREVKKTRTKMPEDPVNRKNSSPLARIWEAIKRCGQTIWEMVKRLWGRTGLRRQRKAHKKQIKTPKSSRKTNKTRKKPLRDAKGRKNSSLLAKIREAIKKWGDTISGIFRKLLARTGLRRQRKAHKKQIKTPKSSRKINKTPTKPSKDAPDHKNSSLFAKIWETIKKWGNAIREFLRKCRYTLTYAAKRNCKKTN